MTDKQLVTRRELEDFLKLGKNSSLMSEMLRDPRFPPAIVLGDKCKRWYLDEVLEYLESKRK